MLVNVLGYAIILLGMSQLLAAFSKESLDSRIDTRPMCFLLGVILISYPTITMFGGH